MCVGGGGGGGGRGGRRRGSSSSVKKIVLEICHLDFLLAPRNQRHSELSPE